MRKLAQTLSDVPQEQLEGLADHIVGFLTDEEHPHRSSFIGVPPSKSEIFEAIQEWIAQERVLN